MPKLNRSRNLPIIENLNQLLSKYDRVQLVRALEQIEHDISWKVIQAALIQEYQDNMLYTLDNCKKTGKQIEAAHYAGVAETLLDMATVLIPKYKDLLANKSSVKEDPRPEE